MAHDRDALITGIGIVSCLGSGADAHWAALNAFSPVVDTESFPPFAVHPLAPLELDKQIPKRGDQRQMEAWQRMGVFAAGQALDSAGVKGNTDLLSRMGMIVAAGGGERDYAVDAAILSGYPKAANPGAYLNEHLLGDLRPTLFLAQLSNLLAGNISIVHGVIGSSRTFMGEEASGADAVRIACARIAADQGDIILVGGSYNAQRPDVLLHYEMGGVQAHAHVEALAHVADFGEIRVWSRTAEHAQQFARQRGATAMGAEAAVRDADVVVVATSSRQPVLRGEWLKPGAHVNAVGANRPDWRELDDDAMSATLFVDSRAAAAQESGDIMLSRAAIYAEIGELFANAVLAPPRSATTVFKSLGLAVEDLAAAKLVLNAFTR